MQYDLSELPLGMGAGYDQVIVGGFFDDVWKVTKKVIKSPITKAVVGGVAVVFPPVGVPATAALLAADITVRATEKPNVKAALKMAAEKGADYALTQTKDPEARKAIQTAKMVSNTALAAKKGDKHAQATMKILAVAEKARKEIRRHTPDVSHAIARTVVATHMDPRAMAGQAAGRAARAAASRARGRATAPGWVRQKEGSIKRG